MGERDPWHLERATLRERNEHLEQELRRSEALLHAVIENSAEMISLTSADGTSRYLTDSAWRLLGWSREEIGDRTLREQVVAEDRPHVAGTLEGLARTGDRATSTAFRVEHRDGSLRWIESRATNLLDNPDVAAIVGVHRDVTVRMQAEEELRASRDKLEEAQAIAHVGSWTLRFLPDVEIRGSTEWARIFGVPAGAPMSLGSFLEIVHPEDRERFRRATRDAIENGAPADIEHRIQRSDGQVRWVHELGVVEREGPGRPPRMAGTCEDITDRHLAFEALRTSEARLRESETLLRLTGHAARLGGWSIELPSNHVTWSDEVCAILDFPSGTQPTLRHAVDLYPPDSRESIRTKIEACARDGAPFDLELQVNTARGRRIWVRAIGRAERDASGSISMLRGAFQDIDDRRKLQDQFRQAQKMEAVGRLAGGVAHDFNNLLSVVLSYAELAIDGLKVGDPLREDIEEIRRAGQRAAALTRQLLTFSRQQVLAPRVLDLNEIVGAMGPMLRRLLGEDVELTVLTPHPVGRVLADSSQIEQLVMNLAINARDAMPDGGKLTIETSNASLDEANAGRPPEIPEGLFILLAVSDSGTGMTEATRARIFEPFFTTKETGKGTGLGLATVFGIVQQSGGYVSVYSEPGHGSTFKVYLPRTDKVAVARVSDAPAAALDGSETILLVEDEDSVRVVACAILRRHGYNVIETSNGGEAFLVSSDFQAKIDLLLTDVVMPRISGRRLAEQLTVQRPEMKVLFASGYTDDVILHHGVLDAGVAFLQKPFTPQALLKKVREVLDAGGRQKLERPPA